VTLAKVRGFNGLGYRLTVPGAIKRRDFGGYFGVSVQETAQ
jgi:hypothetical protein